MWGSSGNVGAEFVLAALLLMVTVAFAALGYAVFVAPVRENPDRCTRRRFAHCFGCTGFLIGGLYWVFTSGRYSPSIPVAGLVFGAVLGELVGALVWLRLKSVDEEVGS